MQPLWQLIGPEGRVLYFLIEKISGRRTQPALAKGAESKHARSTALVLDAVTESRMGLRFAQTVKEVKVAMFRLKPRAGWKRKRATFKSSQSSQRRTVRYEGTRNAASRV